MLASPRYYRFLCYFLLFNIAYQTFSTQAKAANTSDEAQIECDAIEFDMSVRSTQVDTESSLFHLSYKPKFKTVSQDNEQGIEFQLSVNPRRHTQSFLEIKHMPLKTIDTETEDVLDIANIQIVDLELKTQSDGQAFLETRPNILAHLEGLKTAILSEDEELNPLLSSREGISSGVLFPLSALDQKQRWQSLREAILGIYAKEGLILNNIADGFQLEIVEDGRSDLSLLPRKFKLIAVVNEVQFGEVKLKFTSLDPDDTGENIEISLEDIEARFDTHHLCARLLDAVGGFDAGVDYETVNQRLQYLKSDPLFQNIEAYLQRDEDARQEDSRQVVNLEILVAAEKKESFNLTFENTTPASVGDTKFGLSYTNNNLTTVGDRLNIGYTGTTTGGIRAANFSYEVPLDAQEKTLTLGFSPTWTKVTAEPFNEFDIKARSQLFLAEYRHPLIRSLDTDLAFTLGLEVQNGRTFIFNDVPTSFGNGADDQGRTRTSSFTFGQEYVSRSPFGAWALNSKFYFGSDLFGATTGTWDEPGGIFSKWKGSIQRLQRLSEKHQLLIQTQWQLSPKSLASSQQFVIGGMNSVRGYRASARSADNGFRFSFEDFITLDTNEIGNPIFQLVPFVDLGLVWNNPQTSNGLSDQRFLFSTGVGLRFNELFGDEDMSARVDFAYPFIDLKDKGNSLQDKGIYFSVGYTLD